MLSKTQIQQLAAIAKDPNWLLLVNDGQDFRVVRSIVAYSKSMDVIHLANGDSRECSQFEWDMFIAARPVDAFLRAFEPAGEDVGLSIDLDDYPMF